MGETNSGENLNYLVPPNFISSFKIRTTQIPRHLLDYNAFCLIQE